MPCTPCVAPQVRGKDEYGNYIVSGGASVRAALFLQPAGGKASEVAAGVTDEGDGTYAISVTVTAACDFKVVAALASNAAVATTVPGCCLPGDVCPAKCERLQVDAEVVAGTDGVLHLARCDKYGNRLADASMPLPLSATASGPDAMDVRVLEQTDGSVKVQYSARKAGEYRLAVASSSSGEAFAGSPWVVRCVAAPILPENCEAKLTTASGQRQVVAGAAVSVSLTFKDKFGNVVPAPGTDLPVSIRAVGPEEIAFSAAKGGSCTASLTACGSYLVYASVGDVTITGWPQVLHVLADGSDPARCYVTGAPASGLRVGESVTLLIHTLDAHGNPRGRGGEDVVLELQGPEGSTVAKGWVVDNDNGTYSARFKVDRPGRWLLKPRVNRRFIGGDGYELQASSGSLTAMEYLIQGLPEGPLAAGTEVIAVVTTEVEGAMVTGTELFSAILAAPDGTQQAIPLRVADNKSGYMLPLPLLTAGQYSLSVVLDGADVLGSPSHLAVVPSGVDLLHCALSGPGLHSVKAGEPATFTIVAADAYGNALTRGGGKFACSVVDAGGNTCDGGVRDHKDGTYDITFAVTAAGEYTATVTAAGAKGARTFTGVCQPGKVAASACGALEKPPKISAGGEGVLTLVCKDRHGNVVPSCGAGCPLLAESAGDGLTVSCHEEPGGHVVVRYSGKSAGSHPLTVFDPATREYVHGSPFTVDVMAGHVEPRRCTAHVSGREGAAVRAGDSMLVSVDLKDAYGNTVRKTKAASAASVRAVGPAEVEFELNKTGALAGQLTMAGLYTLSATIDGVMLKGWPKTVQVQPAASGSMRCTLVGDALAKGLVVGQSTQIIVQVTDEHGNLRMGSSDAVEVAVVSGDGEKGVAVVASESGSGHCADIVVKSAGIYKLVPKLNGLYAKDAAREVTAMWPAITGADTVVREAPGGRAFAAGEEATFELLPRQAKAGRTFSGAEAVAASVTAPNGKSFVLPVRLADGSSAYTLPFKPLLAGTYTLAVAVGSVPVSGTPLQLEAAPGAPCLPACTFAGAGMARAVAGAPASFVITAVDAHGNTAKEGGAPFRISLLQGMEGEGVLPASVADNNDGTYKVAYTLNKAGPYAVKVELDGAPDSTTLQAVCAPGATVGRSCVVESADEAVAAGETGYIKLSRCDRYGNRVTSGAGQPPVTATCASGSQPLQLRVLEQGDGTVLIGYSPSAAGTYVVQLACGEGSDAAVGAPVQLCCNPGTVAPANCKAVFDGAAASGAVPAGGAVSVMVTLADAYGNVLPDSSDDVSVEVLAPLASKFTKEKGGYRATLQKASTYLVAAKVAGCTLAGWPKQLHVAPGPASAPHCTLSGAALEQVVCGAPTRLTLQARDAFGNVRTAGGDHVQFKAQGVNVSVAEKGEVVDNGDGTYRLQVSVDYAGAWTLVPAVNGTPVRNEGWAVTAVHGPLGAGECVLAHASLGLVCGQKDVFTVKPKCGSEQSRKVTGSEHLTASLASPSGSKSPVPVTLMSGCDGYQVDVAWREAGEHSLSVFLDGQHIVGSPLQLAAQPGPLAPAACTVTNYRNAQGVLELTVEGRDELNNACKLPLDAVALTANPRACLEVAAPVLAGDGRSATLTATVKERGAFNVAVAGRALFASDRTLQWAGSRDALSKTLRPLLATPVVSAAGAPCAVLFTLANTTGLPEVAATLADAAGAAVAGAAPAVKPREDGLYEVAFTCTKAGAYVLSACLKDEPAVAARVSVSVTPGAVSPQHCSVDGGEMRCVAGSSAKLVLARADQHGNKVSDSAFGFRASASGPGPAVVEASELAGGKAAYMLKARSAGKYAVALCAQASGEAVAGSPFEVEVLPGPVSGGSSSFMVAGFTGKAASCVAAGQEVSLLVDTRDKYGNAAAAQPSHMTATAHGPQGIVKFACKEGSASAQPSLAAVITVAGRYSLDVQLLDPATNQWHKVAADETRSTLVVRAAALSNSHTTFTEVPATIMAGIPAELYIQPTDKYGNRGATGGSFLVQLYDGKEAIACPVTRSGEDGAPIVAKVVAQRTGSYKVRVIVAKGDTKELCHTADVNVIEAVSAAEASYIQGHWPPSGPVANIPAGFVIQACDKYGNPRTKGGDRFVVDIMGLPSQAVQVVDRGDGQYNVQYTVPNEGSYRVTVMLEGHHIQGSPTSLAAFRDVVGMANLEMERRMATTVSQLRRGIAGARSLHQQLRDEAASLEHFIPLMVEGTRNGIYEALRNQDALLAETRAAYAREALERRRLHNMVQELRGNIRVYVRVKPLAKEEEASGMFSVLKCTDDHRISCTAQGAPKAFEFDRTFGPNSAQEEVFEDVSQLVTSALDGYNVCIFAYGQTGAGKTYTMEGTNDNPGINYRTMRELFRCINEEHTADYTHNISVSIVEIYNEVVHDLLHGDGKQECELQRTNTGFDVVGLTEIDVTSPEQIFGIMASGFEHRAVGCHDINAHSSRSHCLLIIHVRVENKATGIVTCGKLTLCDLAGSERINKTHATGLTLTEAQNINRSLLELGNVISALMQQAAHIPYRNSKLTMLLQDSLGGDSKALMFCNVSPASVHVTESLSSLAFASKVSNVVLKTPQKKFEEQPASGSAAISAAAKARLMGPAGSTTKGKRTMSSIPTLGGSS